MRKLIAAISLICLIIGSAMASETGILIEKQVNGDYKSAFVVNFELGNLPKGYINTQAVFVAPRSNFKAMNHEYFQMTIGSKTGLLGGELALETGFQRWWGGNSQGNPDGQIDSTNAMSWMKQF
ncbi:MAG TPA: hypothetical protein P5110_07630 [Candidatus Omnitrophota bacterium]|nr:hypothetical protein [Candidatus Omnitrophota bacterium]